MSRLGRAVSALLGTESKPTQELVLATEPARDTAAVVEAEKGLQTLNEGPGWFPIIDIFPGAWQQDFVPKFDAITSSQAVFACGTLIAQDIGKMRARLMAMASSGIWQETTSPAFSPVLRKPNHYQNWIQFAQTWQLSLSFRGNTYVLKERDNRGVVVGMYILHPDRVITLVSDSGEVFYSLMTDNLIGLEGSVIVPATEIIHDRINAIHHPLLGLSPIYACALAALQSLKIQRNSLKFFENMSRPSGILTTEQRISDVVAKEMGQQWATQYTGLNSGKVAVLGSGLKYEAMSVSADDAQLIEQLQFTAIMVCSVFHVPPYMVGAGTMPPYNNIEALNQQYYAQALQSRIGQMECSLDDGLELYDTANPYCVRLDVKALLRMDTAARYKAHSDSILGGWMKPNDARADEDLPPVEGGDQCYLQQQNYSLAALAKRDAAAPAPAANAPGSQPQLTGPKPAAAPAEEDPDEAAKSFDKAFEEMTL